MVVLLYLLLLGHGTVVLRRCGLGGEGGEEGRFDGVAAGGGVGGVLGMGVVVLGCVR